MELRGPEVKISKGRPLSIAERYLERALFLYSKERYDEALTDMDDAITAEPRNAELYATRGFVLLRAGYEDEAVTDFDKALRINPQQWIAHYGRAMIAYKKGDLDTALSHLAIGKVIAPKRPEILIYMASIYFHKKDPANATRIIDSAAELLKGEDGDKKLLKEAQKWQKAIKELPQT